MTNTRQDVVSIGAGPVGENVADRVVQSGLTAAIAERELVGGECSYLHAATIAITAEVPLDRLWHAVPAYPTINEIWLRVLETDGRNH